MNWVRAIIIILIVLFVALIGGYITRGGLPWLYSDGVQLSPHMPPQFVFPIVWSLIYIGYAYVWASMEDTSLDYLYLLSILINLSWVIVFFGCRDVVTSRVIICALCAVVLMQAIDQWQRNNGLGTFIMLFYLAWLIVATGVNFETIAY